MTSTTSGTHEFHLSQSRIKLEQLVARHFSAESSKNATPDELLDDAVEHIKAIARRLDGILSDRTSLTHVKKIEVDFGLKLNIDAGVAMIASAQDDNDLTVKMTLTRELAETEQPTITQ